MASASTAFERGGEYFFLVTEKSSDPSKATEIHHPAPSLSHLEGEVAAVHLSSNSSVRQRIGHNRMREKVHFAIGTCDIASQSGNSGPAKRPKPLKSYVSQNSLERTLSDFSTITESDDEEPAQNRHMGHKLDSELVPFNVKIVPGESPYRRPQQISIYGGKPSQTWFYDQQTRPLLEPPKVPKGISVPFKSLYICDTVNDGCCTRRQIWINEGVRVINWMVVQEAGDAKQVIDKEAYVCYVCEKGPRWVKRSSYITYQGRKAHRDG